MTAQPRTGTGTGEVEGPQMQQQIYNQTGHLLEGLNNKGKIKILYHYNCEEEGVSH